MVQDASVESYSWRDKYSRDLINKNEIIIAAVSFENRYNDGH
jgi:hypothetical protein